MRKVLYIYIPKATSAPPRAGTTGMYVCVYMYICIYVYMYIYIYPPTPADSMGSASEKRGQEGQEANESVKVEGLRQV